MVGFIGKQICKKLKKTSNILFLGLTFKEDVPDLRNSKSLELILYLKKKNHKIVIYDPFVRKIDGFKGFQSSDTKKPQFDCIVLSVPHALIIKELKKKFIPLLKADGFFFDIKGKFRHCSFKNYWSL